MGGGVPRHTTRAPGATSRSKFPLSASSELLSDREVRAVAALNHPNICHLYDDGASPSGFGYLVMELVDGAPIASIDDFPALLLDQAIPIADGLSAAHAVGMDHPSRFEARQYSAYA